MTMVPVRRTSRAIKLGGLIIGGRAPISVQSMTNTDTRDIAGTVQQIKNLERAGCELVRVAVVDVEAATAIRKIKQEIQIPVVADIHFDYKLALHAIDSQADGLRLNPGNIGSPEKVAMVAAAARDHSIPIRIGVNAGSLDKRLMQKYGGVSPAAMVESALEHIILLEKHQFSAIKVSLKASDVPLMVEAYRLLASRVDYPLHLGVTESGTVLSGAVKSAVGIGILLSEGIGDTIRVSLTSDPIYEVRVGYHILKSLGLRQRGAELVSCPTCGRCQVDLVPIAEQVEQALEHISTPIKVAVMGCAVNGPGEARQADVGLAGGKGFALIFRRGKVIRKVPSGLMLQALLEEVNDMLSKIEACKESEVHEGPKGGLPGQDGGEPLR